MKKLNITKEWTSPRKTIQKIKSGELYQKRMSSLEKAIEKFLDSDGVKGQAGTWVLISDENGDIKLYENYGYLVGTIIDGHMIWRDNEEYFVSETYSNMILKSLYDGGLIDKYTLKESTKKFGRKFKESVDDDAEGKSIFAKDNNVPRAQISRSITYAKGMLDSIERNIMDSKSNKRKMGIPSGLANALIYHIIDILERGHADFDDMPAWDKAVREHS